MGRFTEKIQELVEKYLQAPQRFDPSRIEDPLAQRTEWSPAKNGGTNMCTHRLKETAPVTMAFKPVPFAVIFPVIFIGFGLPMPLFFLLTITRNPGLEDFNLMTAGIIILFTLVFSGIGVGLLIKTLTPRVFSRESGYYWKGWKEPSPGLGETKGEYCSLSEIHAVQIIQELCRNSSKNGTSTYYSYEINLVLHDGSRLNVVDHGKVSAIRTDGVVLAHFLGVPLWDSTTS